VPSRSRTPRGPAPLAPAPDRTRQAVTAFTPCALYRHGGVPRVRSAKGVTMKRLLSVALALMALGIPAASAAAGSAAPPRVDSVLVKFRAHVPAARFLLKGDVLLGRTLNGVSVVRVKRGVPVAARVKAYDALPAVVYAEPNALARADLSSPNDPSYGSQWALGAVHAAAGWSSSPGSYTATGGPTIAVVDTGVESTHADLQPSRVLVSSGANCLSSSGTCVADAATDDNGHGTHVAGIAAASTNNATGIAGAAYASPILPVKVLNSAANGSYAGIANGILWAAQHGARVINLSLGGSTASQTLCDAVASAISSGVVVVASAGNGSTSAANYPAACPGAVGVAATDERDAAASFSNYGSPDVFVSAPGANIYSTYRGGGYTTLSGTSMAAPLVTGLAALLREQQPARTVAQVKSILATTSDKVGSAAYGADPYATCAGCTWSTTHGYGRVNFERALGGNTASPPPSSSDFAVAASPPLAAVAPGSSATYDVSVTANGGSASVALAASGLPAGATATFTPATVQAPGSSTLVVATSSSTPVGRYTVSIDASSGGVVRSTSVTLLVAVDLPVPPVVPPVPPVPPVVPPVPVSSQGDFTLAITPATATVLRGMPATYALTLSGAASGAVKLTLTGERPPGATVAFAPALAPAPGASTLTVATTLGTPPGTYVLTVNGERNGLVRTASATLVVQ
jgi:thermitase